MLPAGNTDVRLGQEDGYIPDPEPSVVRRYLKSYRDQFASIALAWWRRGWLYALQFICVCMYMYCVRSTDFRGRARTQLKLFNATAN